MKEFGLDFQKQISLKQAKTSLSKNKKSSLKKMLVSRATPIIRRLFACFSGYSLYQHSKHWSVETK